MTDSGLKGTKSLTHQELTDLRKRAVTAVQSGESPKTVAKVLGTTVDSVYRWLSLYRNGGWGKLDAKKRGGRRPKLDGKQLKELYDAITMGDPRQYKFKFALWTSRMIRAFIEQRFGVSLSKASVCRLLNQLGITPQKPLHQAYQRNPKAVQRWEQEEYPRIKALAKQHKAEIFFADEAGVRSDQHRGRTWSKKGETPIVKGTGSRFSFNLISAVSARGDMRFMFIEGSFNADVFIEFLERLTAERKRPIYLIVDGHPVHRSKRIEEYVESKHGMLKLFRLPGYSPDLNPDELVWNDLKRELGKTPTTTKQDLKKRILSHMRRLQKLPKRISSFFQKPSTKYAA